MSRKRGGAVGESIEQLRELERRHKGKAQALRVKFLLLLKESPETRMNEAAVQIGCSEQTVKRWWSDYRQGGIESLMRSRTVTRRSAQDPRLEELRKKLAAGELTDLDELRDWVEATEARHEKKGKAVAIDFVTDATARTDKPDVDTQALPDRVLTFLNTLPATGDIQEWVDGFRAAMYGIFSDLDHISVSVNMRCDLIRPELYNPDVRVVQHLTKKDEKIDIPSGVADNHIDLLLEGFHRSGFPMDKYHPPQYLVIYYQGKSYIGTIFLWRDKGGGPISERTLTTLNRLEPFFSFLMSDLVARTRYARPVDEAFTTALEQLVHEVGLTRQEQRIVLHHTLGYSYEQMAEMMNVSVNTIRHHVKAVYTKTGTHSQAELFAKYFTPRSRARDAEEEE